MRPSIPLPPFHESKCSGCGNQPVTWVVTIAYAGPGSRGPGRVLWRCDRCMEADMSNGRISLLLPVSVIAADPDAVMAALYLGGATESDVDTVAEALSLTGPWVEIARAHLLAKQPPE